MARAWKTATAIVLAARGLSEIVAGAIQPAMAVDLILSVAKKLPQSLRLSLFIELEMALRRRAAALGQPTVEYAGELLPDDKKQLDEIISKKVGTPVSLSRKLNCELIAGIRVSVGDRRWEFSVRSALEQFIAGS